MATLRYQVGIPHAKVEVHNRVKSAALRAGGGTFVVSSAVRPGDLDSLHSKGLAEDISKRQSSGDLNALYDELLKEKPDELFYEDRLMDKGKTFTDAALSAAHRDHLHVAWDALPGLIDVSDRPSVSAGNPIEAMAHAIGFLFDDRGLLRIASVLLGFGALAIGVIALLIDSSLGRNAKVVANA